METTIDVASESGNKIPDKYRHCQKCGLSLGIVAWKDEAGSISIKFLANSGSVVLNINGGFHLKKACIPANTSADVNEVTNFVTGYSISKDINRQREVEVSKCPICLSSIFCNDEINNELNMVELPCKHMVCAQCLVSLFRTYQFSMGHGKFECPICKFNILHNIKEDVLRTTSASAAAPMAPPAPIADIFRTCSSGLTMSSLSAPPPQAPPPPGSHYGIGGLHQLHPDIGDDFYLNPVFEVSNFEQLRLEFFGDTNPVDAQQVMLDPSTNPRIASCLNVGCSCTSELVGSGYNDLVACIFEVGENSHRIAGYVNFINTHYENECFTIKHSGDFLTNEGGFHVLKHFVLIKEKPGEPTQHVDSVMVPLDMACDPSPELMSTSYHLMGNEFQKYFERVRPMFGDDRQPRYVIIFSQVTYLQSQTLRFLSPNMAPSSGFLSTNLEGLKTVNACDWKNDNANMTAWGCLFVY